MSVQVYIGVCSLLLGQESSGSFLLSVAKAAFSILTSTHTLLSVLQGNQPSVKGFLACCFVSIHQLWPASAAQ